MKLLLDECVDERLRLAFTDHDCQTARFANLTGLKNGRLLDAAEAARFDVLITVDQSIPDQQNLTARKIAIVILIGVTNRLKDLMPLVAAALSAIASIEQGQVLRIQSARPSLSRSEHQSVARYASTWHKSTRASNMSIGFISATEGSPPERYRQLRVPTGPLRLLQKCS